MWGQAGGFLSAIPSFLPDLFQAGFASSCNYEWSVNQVLVWNVCLETNYILRSKHSTIPVDIYLRCSLFWTWIQRTKCIMATDIFFSYNEPKTFQIKVSIYDKRPKAQFLHHWPLTAKKQVYDEWKDILQQKILHRSWDPRHRQQAIDIPLGAEVVCTLRGKTVSMDKWYGTTRGEMYENTPDKLFLYGNLHVGEYKGFIKCFFCAMQQQWWNLSLQTTLQLGHKLQLERNTSSKSKMQS